MTVIPNIRPEGAAQLFSRGELSRILGLQYRRLTDEIERLPRATVLQGEFDELVASIRKQYWLDVPQLDRGGIEQSEPIEAKVDARQLPGRFVRDTSRPIMINATRFTFTVPFLGDPGLLDFRASTHSLNPPMATVSPHELQFVYTVSDPDAEALRTALQQELAMIEETLGWVSTDVAPFNDTLETEIRRRLEARRDRLRANSDISTALGFPIRRRSDAPQTYTVPTRRKTIDPTVPLSANRPEPPDPVLGNAVYEEILRIMDNMVDVMEKSPHAFKDMGEEDLRTHFLVQLNGQYEGSATGETFNFEGKTDILIKHEGRNIFIAECLVWSGPRSLSAKIAQLLTYASWRDTKTAIVVFSRNKDFSAVLEQIVPTVLDHSNVIEQVDVPGETHYRFIVRHRDDPNRHLTLTVMAYNVPT